MQRTCWGCTGENDSVCGRVHRFNKGQQDYLLPFVEDGTLVLIGATTENPYFEVNSALLSRSIIFELKPLAKKDIMRLLEKAVADENGGDRLVSGRSGRRREGNFWRICPAETPGQR